LKRVTTGIFQEGAGKLASLNRTYRLKENTVIDGVFAMAFIRDGDYHLTPIKIYQDGMIDCWELVTFEEFKAKVRAGEIVTHPPDGAQINVPCCGRFKAVNGAYWVEAEEFIKEVADEIEELNGRSSTADCCYEAYNAYLADATEENLQHLRECYESVPEHSRVFILGDMDASDSAIRAVLYGEEARKE
jgi:hypothetical protein